MALRELCADDGGLVVRGAVGRPPVPAFTPPGRRRLLLEEARVDGLDVARQVRVARAVLGRAVSGRYWSSVGALPAPGRAPSRAQQARIQLHARFARDSRKTGC